jgi:hypothetical protein
MGRTYVPVDLVTPEQGAMLAQYDLNDISELVGGEGLGLLEIGLGCSLEVDERTRSTPWRRDYQHRRGPGKSCRR